MLASAAMMSRELDGRDGGFATIMLALQGSVTNLKATLEAAQVYCEREGFAYAVTPAPQRKLKLQAYADNFR